MAQKSPFVEALFSRRNFEGQIPEYTWCSALGLYPSGLSSSETVKCKIDNSNETNFTLAAYNLTLDDLWSWYVTFDFINIQRFPCCMIASMMQVWYKIGLIEPIFICRAMSCKNMGRDTVEPNILKVIARPINLWKV